MVCDPVFQRQLSGDGEHPVIGQNFRPSDRCPNGWNSQLWICHGKRHRIKSIKSVYNDDPRYDFSRWRRGIAGSSALHLHRFSGGKGCKDERHERFCTIARRIGNGPIVVRRANWFPRPCASEIESERAARIVASNGADLICLPARCSGTGNQRAKASNCPKDLHNYLPFPSRSPCVFWQFSKFHIFSQRHLTIKVNPD